MARLLCTNHPHQRASFHCMECGVNICVDCTDHRWTPRGFVDHCRTCKRELEQLSAAKAGSMAAPGPQAFIDRLPELLAFPAERSVLFMLIGLTLLTAPLQWATQHNIFFGYGAIGWAIYRGLEISVYFRFVSQTAFGHTQIDPPDFTSLSDDLISPVRRYLAALLPLLAGIFLFGMMAFDSFGEAFEVFESQPWQVFKFIGPAILISFGLILLPLLTVVAAVAHSFFTVLDPRIWFHSISVMGGTYFVGAVAFYLVLLVETLVWIPLMMYLRTELSIPVVTTLITTFAIYLPLALRARILGAIVEPYVDELT